MAKKHREISRTESAGRAPRGIPFEKAVAAVQALLDPAAQVTHNARLCDRLGHWRQFDVVIRAKAGGHDVLGVIECKDLQRPVGTPEVNAFADKARNVLANLTLLASRRGFTKQALELAKFHGIGTVSLLKAEAEETGFTVGVPSYGELFRWERAKTTVHFAERLAHPPHFVLDDLSIEGQSVAEWLKRELYTTYREVEGKGWYTLLIDFSRPTELSIAGKSYPIRALRISVLRSHERRTRQIQWGGQALYDWQKGQLLLPAGGNLVTTGLKPDLSDWEPFEGEFPSLGGSFIVDFRLTVFHHLDNLPPLNKDLRTIAEVRLLPPAA